MQRIGVLRGGPGDEYHLSLASGARIMEALRNEGYDTVDLFIDREGVLHIKGMPVLLIKSHSILTLCGMLCTEDREKMVLSKEFLMISGCRM